MSNLEKWENIIKEKRKQTNFKDYLKEIVSWYPFAFYKKWSLITNFPYSNRINEKIITPIEFDDNRDNLLNKWLNYDLNKSFFLNFQKLFISIPWYNLFSFNTENAQYADNVYNSKNTYLSNWVIHNCENVFYSFYIKENCSNIFNSFMVWDNCDNIYNSSWVIKSYNIFYSRNILNCSNIWFSSNLTWCTECLFCDNLENIKYCIKNKQYTKEEFIEEKKKILNNKNEFHKYYLKVNFNWKWPFSKNTDGIFLPLCENIESWYYSYNVHSWKNIILTWSKEWNTDFFDVFWWWSPTWNRYYGCCYVWTYSEDLFLCHSIDYSKNLYYCYYLTNCSYCIWCVWLKNKSYCILNNQYTKEEWYELADKIFAQMDRTEILGDFFPWELNPFYFNDTIAYLLDNTFTKEEIIADWYMWRDEEILVDIPEWVEVLNIDDLDIVNYDKSILEKVIKDQKWNYYRIVKIEYDFLKKHNLPLPEIHWLDRIKLWFKF